MTHGWRQPPLGGGAISLVNQARRLSAGAVLKASCSTREVKPKALKEEPESSVTPVTCRVGHALPVEKKMDKIKMVVLTGVWRPVSWLIQEIGPRSLRTHPQGLSTKLLCPSFSMLELFVLPVGEMS